MKGRFQHRGKLFVFEGIDGSGKSSLLSALIEKISCYFPGKTIVAAKEPGSCRLAEDIRHLLLRRLNDSEQDPVPLAECLLFNAARAQMVEKFLKPNLLQGNWVFLDRYILSTFAYQGATGQIDPHFLEQLVLISAQGVYPDFTFFLKAPLAVCRARRLSQGRQEDRIEQRREKFFERVEEIYQEKIEQFKNDNLITVLDACLPLESLVNKALGLLLDELQPKALKQSSSLKEHTFNNSCLHSY